MKQQPEECRSLARFTARLAESLTRRRPLPEIYSLVLEEISDINKKSGGLIIIKSEPEAEPLIIRDSLSKTVDLRPAVDKLTGKRDAYVTTTAAVSADMSHADDQRRLLVAPIYAAERFLGAVLIPASRPERLFTPLQTLTAITASSFISVAVENDVLINQASDEAEDMILIGEIYRELTTARQPLTMLNRFLSKTRRLLGAEAAFVHLWDDKRKRLVLKTRSGPVGGTPILRDLEAQESIIGWTAANQQTVELSPLDDTPYAVDFNAGRRFNYLLATPIIARADVLGVIAYLAADAININERKKSLWLNLVSVASVSLDNIILFEKADRLARTDYLTGLLNHREFQRLLEREINRSGRFGRRLTMLMADIDYFKNYNDNNGHDRGDAALRKIGKLIRAGIRRIDYAFRYGGEEFAVLLLEADEDEARHIAERLRRQIRRADFPGREKQPNRKLTVSIGIASFPEPAADKISLVRMADKALYLAKKSGRNQVCEYSEIERNTA